MTDIYDIKNSIIWLPINLLYSGIYIILLLIIYYISIYWIKKNKKEKKIKTSLIIESPDKIDYRKELKQIENNIELYPSNVFYSKISNLLKMFIENEQGKKINSKTLEELDLSNFSIETGNLIKNLYYKLYKDNNKDNLKIRQNIINSIKKIIWKTWM